MAEQVPGFGGFFPDSQGTVVWLTDPEAQASAARQAIAEVAEQAQRVRETSIIVHSRANLSFKQADYTLSQLHAWKQSLYIRGIPAGTSFTGINKRLNRLAIAVENEAAKAPWIAQLRASGVPLEAVAFETLPNPLPAANLQGKVRPVVGGVQIGDPKQCSLTTGVTYRLDPANKHFITVSHCSVNQWALDNVGFHECSQPSFPDTISVVEVADPPPFTGGACPAGRVCRYTDAAVVRYKDPAAWTFATVAAASNPAPFAITATYSLTEQPFVLWEWPVIRKTGRTTGTTTNPDVSGSETNYCYDWHVPNPPLSTPNRTVLCQILYPPGFVGGGGDSGAPVFGQYGFQYAAGQAYLVGIYAGGAAGESKVVSPAGLLWSDFGFDEAGGFIVYYTCVGVGFC